MFSVLLGVRLGVELPGRMVTVFNFGEPPWGFLKQLHRPTFPQQRPRVPIPTPSPMLVTVHLFCSTILVGVRWHLIVVLICIFLRTDDVKHPFLGYGTFDMVIASWIFTSGGRRQQLPVHWSWTVGSSLQRALPEFKRTSQMGKR